MYWVDEASKALRSGKCLTFNSHGPTTLLILRSAIAAERLADLFEELAAVRPGEIMAFSLMPGTSFGFSMTDPELEVVAEAPTPHLVRHQRGSVCRAPMFRPAL
ncbi:MAG: hypothetical protein WCI74_00895 [Actinomycetes bacterium]